MKEDLEKFKWLSGVDSLKIDTKKCLSYEHESQKGGEETEQFRMPKSDEKIAGTISSRNEKPPAMFQHKYKRRRRCSLSVSEFHCGVSHPQAHSEESNTFGRSCKLDGPTTMPRIAFPKFKDYFTDKSVILTGTARRELTGPPIGIVDIGISKAAYFFQVALPGVRSDSCTSFCCPLILFNSLMLIFNQCCTNLCHPMFWISLPQMFLGHTACKNYYIAG
jgi:hypothetical protein